MSAVYDGLIKLLSRLYRLIYAVSVGRTVGAYAPGANDPDNGHNF